MRKALGAAAGVLLVLALGAGPAQAQAGGQDGWECLLEGRTWVDRPWEHHQHFKGAATCERADDDDPDPVRQRAGTFQLELWPDVCLESRLSYGRLSIALQGDDEPIVERPVFLYHSGAVGVITDRIDSWNPPGVGFGAAAFVPARTLDGGMPLHQDCDPEVALDMFVEATYTILDGLPPVDPGGEPPDDPACPWIVLESFTLPRVKITRSPNGSVPVSVCVWSPWTGSHRVTAPPG